MLDDLEATARRAAPAVQQWSVRGVVERSEEISVRQGVVQAPRLARDAGVMVSVVDRGALGYAATPDASPAGLARAFARARELAHAAAGRSVFDFGALPPVASDGRYASRVERPAAASTLAQRIDRVRRASDALRVDERIVDWSATLYTAEVDQLVVTGAGGRVEQRVRHTTPNLQATARIDGVTQTRSAYGQYNGFCQQGGLEVLDRALFDTEGPRVAHEALALAAAPPCPSGEMDVLLMPDQMMLQIHESIGHPLELDRILGDERNYAGTSFVTLDMFGRYRWGSELLDVTVDPTRGEQIATTAFDDEGAPTRRRHVIERGILVRPLGGDVSLARARALGVALGGVAAARACSWNRPPIDRMGNLNVEPGTSTLDEMIAAVEHGVLMRTNCSWSIDDSRNKFQFGCELGQVIRDGRLAGIVRNPSYRGVSATFWRSLAMVGDASTFEVMGTPFCGKGEPSQGIRVGHASPACLFRGVAVFGGEA